MASTSTSRSTAKAERRQALIIHAAHLFAQNGYAAVSLEEIGQATGVSGPAIYRHFAGKQDLLASILMHASEGLVTGAKSILAEQVEAEVSLRRLIAFHVDFALQNPDVIKVQDREVGHLAIADRNRMRSLQRDYVRLWAEALSRLVDAPANELRLRTQATFGLLNSTPHAADATSRALPQTRSTLEAMAFAALAA